MGIKRHGADYDEYINSPEWKRIKKQAVEESNRICDKCKWPIAKNEIPHGHHSSYKNFTREGFDDVKIDHGECHRATHFGRAKGDD
jgi:hypothetical protein